MVTVRGAGDTEMNKRARPQGLGGAYEPSLVAPQQGGAGG